MFIERFIRYLEFEKRVSPHTLTAYKHDLDQFNTYLTSIEVSLDAVKHRHIRSWLVTLIEANGAKTANRKLSALRSLFKFLQKENLITENPTALVKAIKTPKRLPVVVDDHKLTVLLDNAQTFDDSFKGVRERLIIELLFATGMRLSELTSLQEQSIDFYGRMVKVFGKRSKERIIPLHISVIALLKQYLNEKKKQNFDNKTQALIVTDSGSAAYPNFVYRIVKKYLSYISTADKKSPHVLRHTFATSLLDKGADINAIKELLGHASLAATQVYTHNTAERLKSIYKQAHPKA
ncbi:tyrosine-type recombinase/integrase [Pedobacter sp. BS3]|uniref:tyrosine-type recombinase/integrase n=1 Tax=Pedobacter sp. BS3 TaxID=2567937 RepID=UPI0011ED1503|nr:tyrosine-type recombinase/integrase [Pedobacter sp. BS3]TZF81064.1 tyrosine-type recombinase/integrase [Pedobacter sp. BS3]